MDIFDYRPLLSLHTLILHSSHCRMQSRLSFVSILPGCHLLLLASSSLPPPGCLLLIQNNHLPARLLPPRLNPRREERGGGVTVGWRGGKERGDSEKWHLNAATMKSELRMSLEIFNLWPRPLPLPRHNVRVVWHHCRLAPLRRRSIHWTKSNPSFPRYTHTHTHTHCTLPSLLPPLDTHTHRDTHRHTRKYSRIL